MRLLPVAADGTLRVFPRDMQLGPYRVPAGTEIWVYLYAIHNSSRCWEQPEQFLPVGFARV